MPSSILLLTDYYQPEAYVPTTDTFIEKDASVNAHIEQMRLSATKALLERKDAIIVASVSATYGLGDPKSYLKMMLHLSRGEVMDQRGYFASLGWASTCPRNDVVFERGQFRVRGEVIDIFPARNWPTQFNRNVRMMKQTVSVFFNR